MGTRLRSIALVFVCASALTACAATVSPGRVKGPEWERRGAEQALQLVADRVHYPVVIVDPEGVPESAAVRRLDAFIVVGPDGTTRPTIYLNRESSVVQETASGSRFHRVVLAAVIVHEAAHLSGADESQARVEETRLFAELLAKGVVPSEQGLQYLAVLRNRIREPTDRSQN